MKNTNQLIGCCGLDCEKCDVRIATLTNDNTLREKTAVLWTKLNGVTITPEMINCTGCRIEGAKTPFCDKLCPVHNCVREKKLDTCADCAQMDGCPTLGQIAGNSPSVLDNLKRLQQNNSPAMAVNGAELNLQDINFILLSSSDFVRSFLPAHWLLAVFFRCKVPSSGCQNGLF